LVFAEIVYGTLTGVNWTIEYPPRRYHPCLTSINALSNGPIYPKFQVEGVASRQPFFLSEN